MYKGINSIGEFLCDKIGFADIFQSLIYGSRRFAKFFHLNVEKPNTFRHEKKIHISNFLNDGSLE